MDLEYEIRLNRLVEQALDQPDGERREFLRQQVESDSKLLEEAWQMVQEAEQESDFLEQPVVRGLGDEVSLLGGRQGFQLPFEESGPLQIDQIGPYRLVRPLGAGGMGRVYLAEQSQPVRRQVALKLIRSSVRSPESQARFDAERQALARLNHPNIGQLLEAGTTSFGLQYFVMELVEGKPITSYCDRRNLSLHERLRLFRDVCLGVQHAHQRQTLHRDLKPSNILIATVDGEAVPKIIDFGIAKMLDEDPEGAAPTLGRVLGTPVYMSPEALEKFDGSGDVDERSDVYSLGILLYELVCGLRPFESEGQGLATVLREIAEKEAPSPSARLAEESIERQSLLASRRQSEPSSLRRVLAGDLEWVVVKATAKDREQRYSSAGQLAEDIGRYLRRERVAASPPRIWRDVYRMARRHSKSLINVALVAVAAAAGLFGWWADQRAEIAAQSLDLTQKTLESERLASDRFVYSLSRFLESRHPPSPGDLSDLSYALNSFDGAGIAGRLELMVVLAESLQHRRQHAQAGKLARAALALSREVLGRHDSVTRRSQRLVEEICAEHPCPPAPELESTSPVDRLANPEPPPKP